MNNRNQIIDIYVNDFNTFLRVKRLLNPAFYPNQESIEESIDKTATMYLDVPEMELSEEEKNIVRNKIEALYSIFQEEGSAILGDYDHDYTWYQKLLDDENYNEYYWPRYRNYLETQKHFAPKVLDTLQDKTLKSIMSYLGNPNEDATFSIRGLVVGDVQSGKTSNYLGLISKAADAGYKVIFILTGTIESLRKQTQQRVEEGFVGFDSVEGVDVGVGRGPKTPKAFTSRAKDFTAGDNQNTTYRISDYSSEPMIFVVKKNVPVLKKIFASLKKINTTADHQKINYSMLMIDDEADNASINTNKPENDPTQINKYIRSILSLFTRTSYVGFTATPFANVFINYDTVDEMLGNDLFPKDFIYALNSPSNYCGSRKYFFDNNSNVKYINDDDQFVFPMSHKKDWDGNKLYNSFYHSVNVFALANAIRDLRDADTKTHRSMLINMSRFTNVQGVIKDIVETYFDKLKKSVKQTHRLARDIALTNPIISDLKKSFDLEFNGCAHNGAPITWEMVFDVLYEAIQNIKIVIVNSSKQSEKLSYDEYKKEGLRVIAIGGLALSRGLTLEGLMVSYFYRNTSTFDVLMQMGRWFGYRDGYDDLCRIYLTPTSAEYYKEICVDIECLKDDIKTMCKQHKMPKDYGIRVRNASIEMSITAANKMRNTKNKVIRKSYFGSLFETPYLHRNLEIVKENIEKSICFLDSIHLSQRDYGVTQHPYFRNIEKRLVVDLLEKINVHEANENFDTKQLVSFLQRTDSELDLFDVLVIGGSSPLTLDYDRLDIHMNLVKRKFDIIDNGVEQIIRVNATRAHLWGRSDTKYGLTKREADIVEQDSGSPAAQDYLIQGRNPLLIIYFVDLRNDHEDGSSEDLFTGEVGFVDYLKLMLERCVMDFKFVVGYAIGFPKKEGEESVATLYTVNKTVNYFDKDHEDYSGDDENE